MSLNKTFPSSLTHACTYTHVHMQICICTHTNLSILPFVYQFICLSICQSIYIHPSIHPSTIHYPHTHKTDTVLIIVIMTQLNKQTTFLCVYFRVVTSCAMCNSQTTNRSSSSWKVLYLPLISPYTSGETLEPLAICRL